jgi:FHA domain
VHTVSIEPTIHELPRTLEPASQYLLWIDGVGGYLVCLSHRVTLGQANPESLVDIPLLADVSRHHATLQRDPEGYCLEAIRKVQVNGQATEKVLLRSADRITLGSSCQMQFWQPVPVSTTARLDVVSGHRFLHPVDSVLLMADTLLIGPGPQAHVVVPDLTQPLVLYRNRNKLAARWSGSLVIDGRPHQGKGDLEPGATLQTEQLTLALERPLAG